MYLIFIFVSNKRLYMLNEFQMEKKKKLLSALNLQLKKKAIFIACIYANIHTLAYRIHNSYIYS